MNKWDKFVIILVILAFLANEGIISQTAPEDFIKDEFGLNLVENPSNWSNQLDPENPSGWFLGLLWILLKHFWAPAIIALSYSYIKRNWEIEI